MLSFALHFLWKVLIHYIVLYLFILVYVTPFFYKCNDYKIELNYTILNIVYYILIIFSHFR